MKRALLVAAIAGALTALAWPDAHADYLGSDPFGDLAGTSNGGLMDRYPLSAYNLDTHIDSSTLPGASWGEEAAGFVTSVIWTVTAWIVKTVIGLVVMAFSLDLLGRGGALQPVAVAIRSIHERVLGDPFMVAALACAGLWCIKKAIIERRHAEAASSLGVSAVFVIVCLFLIFKPVQTVGQVAHWTNQVSTGLLTGANTGSLANPERAKQQVADELFRTQILGPWAVLNFGGLRHCVDGTHRDKDGYPRPVAPDDPRRTTCRDHMKQVNGMGGYAPRFLAVPAGSRARRMEFEALKNGEVPTDPFSGDQFQGYHVDKSDSPAVDIQQKGGAYNRLVLAIVIAFTSAGFVVLFGLLALAIILAQIAALLILAFSPVVLLAAVIPGRGHDLFRSWGGKLITALVIKAFYSLVIAVLIAVSAALTAATVSLGWLYAFGLLGAFYAMVFVKRKWMAEQVNMRREYTRSESRVRETSSRAVAAGAGMVVSPFVTLAGLAKGKQESAIDNDGQPPRASGSVTGQEPAAASEAKGPSRSEQAGPPVPSPPMEGVRPAAAPVPSAQSAHNGAAAPPGSLRGHGPASPAVAEAPPERPPTARPPAPLDDPELRDAIPEPVEPTLQQDTAPTVPDLAPPPEYRGPR